MPILTVIMVGLTVAQPHLQPTGDACVDVGLEHYLNGRYGETVDRLGQCLDKESVSIAADRGLYVLGSAYLALGRDNEAVKSFEELLSRYGTSPWAANSCKMLADMAKVEKQWDRASEFTARLIELHVGGKYGTIDDHLCQRMFKQLVTIDKARSAKASEAEIHATLREQYPLTTFTGRVVALRAGVDPEGNLVVNPGFELDGRCAGIPAGWRFLGTEPNLFDDADGVLMDKGYDGLTRAKSGGFCVGKYTGWGVHLGWLYQRVSVKRGQKYEVIAYGLTPTTEGGPGEVRLGADPVGGVNPESETVKWTTPQSPEREYGKLAFEGDASVKAEGDTLTVYLEIRQRHPAAPNAILFDDVMVRRLKD